MAEHEERDDAYRAVGRYVVEFSRLIYQMRRVISMRIAATPEQRGLISLALGEATASQIANAFFAICRSLVNLDSAEEKIALELSKGVNDAIKTRNDFAHGDWWVGFGALNGGKDVPMLARVKPMRKAGALEERDIPVAELDQLCDSLYTLRQHVSEFGDICAGDHDVLTERSGKAHPRISDIFVLRGGQVRREGPLAEASRPHYT